MATHTFKLFTRLGIGKEHIDHTITYALSTFLRTRGGVRVGRYFTVSVVGPGVLLRLFDVGDEYSFWEDHNHIVVDMCKLGVDRYFPGEPYLFFRKGQV